MKKNRINYWGVLPVMAFFVMSVSSCTTNDVGTENMEEVTGITCDASDRFFESSNQTRSSLSYSESKGMVFKWTSGDWLTVFAKGNDANIMNFKIQSGAESKNAAFTSQNFALTPGTRYYSLSKSEQQEDKSNISIPSQNNITLKYSGQEQDGNGNPSHLGKYDFMAASAVCEEEDNAHFSFTHLGATLRIRMYKDAESGGQFDNCSFTEMELYDSENSFTQPERIFSFAAGTSETGYSPIWPEQMISSPERFKLTFKTPVQPSTANLTDGTTSSTPVVVAYIEVPPHNFTGKTLGVMLRGKNASDEEVVFSGTINGMEVKADKAYKRDVKMSQPDEFKVQLKIARKWQLGSDLDATTRATGDPGKDEVFNLPTNIYYVYCFDDEVVKPQNTSDAQVIKTISDIPETDWAEPADEELYTYKHLITLQKPTCKHTSDPGHKCSYRLYVAASRDDLSSFFPTTGENAITEGGVESKVKGVTYNINTSASQETTQSFLKNLYSTAWNSEENKFQGTITDPMQDVILYHTAAKVDLKWNSSTALPITGDAAYVKVNNVLASGLSLFKPTTNTYASGTYNVSSAIEEDVQYNGRQVFYLPQFANSLVPASSCKYNVKIGGKTAEDVTFSPATTNGFTSWLRWLKNY